jgi:hypothetical protein
MPALVLPVPVSLAWRWARGQLSDAELLDQVNLLKPAQALFIVALHGRWAWRELRAQTNRPTLALITRTKNPAACAWLKHYGARPIFQEATGELRWFGGEHLYRRFWQDNPRRKGEDSTPTNQNAL